MSPTSSESSYDYWIGWARSLGNSVIRTWSSNWGSTASGTFWGVVDLDNGAEQTNTYSDPYIYIEGEPDTCIYYLNKKYADSSIDASDVTYDNTQSGITATDVQGAIDEVSENIIGVEANPSGTASSTLNKIEIDGVIYDLPSGGGGGGGSSELGLKYDFTKTPLDVLSLTPITLENVMQTDNGLTFNASNSYAYFSGKMLKRNTIYEFEVASLSITDTTRHNDLFRYQNVGSNQNAGLIYRYQTLKWAVWDGTNGWQDSDISDKDYFNNSIVKIKILDDGKWEIYKNDVLVFAPPLAMVFEGTESFGLGSPNASATSMTIKNFRAYVDGYKESSGGGGSVRYGEEDPTTGSDGELYFKMSNGIVAKKYINAYGVWVEY
jgi:hypothetical protein